MSGEFFPAASPESLGLSSAGILNFLEDLKKEGVVMHGLAILRCGKTAFEGYYKPFAADQLHRMYSTTKSFTSIGIGLLYDEGKLRLCDKAHAFFPDKLPEKMHPFVEAMTVRDLLMMSSAHKSTTYGRKGVADEDWVASFFNTEPAHMPGRIFNYDTSATTTLTAIVERLSGKKLVDFLQDKILRKMGFSEDAFCLLTGDGEFSWGGSGLNCSLRDLSKVAQLLMQKGKWNGEQLISEEYVTAATSRQIDNTISRNTSGYGYQIWRWPGNGFGTSGMGLQNTFCYPDDELILATIADTQAQPGAQGVILGSFLRNVKAAAAAIGEKLPEDEKAYRELKEYAEKLAVETVCGAAVSRTSRDVSGKTYELLKTSAPGTLKFDSVRFDFSDGGGSILLKDSGGEYKINFGFGGFERQDFPGYSTAEEVCAVPPIIFGFGSTKAKLHLDCMISAGWVMENTLLIVCHAVGTYLGSLKIEAVFEGDTVTLNMLKFAERFWEKFQGSQSGVTAE